MNKYKVKVSHLFSEVVSVEAENEDEARTKIFEILSKGDHESKAMYETTIGPKDWIVMTDEKYQELLKKFEEEMLKAEKEKQEENKEPSNIITPDNLKP